MCRAATRPRRALTTSAQGGAMNLDGKVAVPTGSGRGIGRRHARALAEAGSAVVINDVDADVAEQIVKALTDGGAKAVAEVVPVGGTETAQRLVQKAVDSFGGIDI